MATNFETECPRSSTEQKLTTTSLPKISESPELRPQRNKHRSSKKKQNSSAKLTKDEIKYQRFVRDLKKDIQVQMKQYMREDRFDTRDHRLAKTDPSIRLLRIAVKSKQTPSTIVSHRTNDSGTVITSLSNQQDPMSFLKYNEEKRLAADVQKIIAGPAMKTFYTQFIRPLPKQQQQIPVPFQESFFNLSEQ